MAGRSARNRRVPPKGNPGEPGTQQQQFNTGQPVASIPWKTLVITTGLTTLTGYVVLELLRGAHRYLKHRGEAIAGAKNPKDSEDERRPGALPNGTFQLPLPDGTAPVDFSGPPHGGFGSPRLADVNNPLGRLEHDLHQYQNQMDARFNRIEQMLSRHYGATG